MKMMEKTKEIDLTEDDLVFITNGCCTDTSCYGDQDNALIYQLLKMVRVNLGIYGKILLPKLVMVNLEILINFVIM